jgi:oligopeptidase A
VVTLDMPSYLACMQGMKNRGIREQLYRAYLSRASSGTTDNCGIITSILKKKRAMSRMLVRWRIESPIVTVANTYDAPH